MQISCPGGLSTELCGRHQQYLLLVMQFVSVYPWDWGEWAGVGENDAGDVAVKTQMVRSGDHVIRSSAKRSLAGDAELVRSFFAICAVMASAEITVQAAVDKIDDFSDRDADTTDSDLRYMAYGARLRTALRAASRYVAYVCELLSVSFVLTIGYHYFIDERCRRSISSCSTPLDCYCSIRCFLVISLRVCTVYKVHYNAN